MVEGWHRYYAYITIIQIVPSNMKTSLTGQVTRVLRLSFSW